MSLALLLTSLLFLAVGVQCTSGIQPPPPFCDAIASKNQTSCVWADSYQLSSSYASDTQTVLDSIQLKPSFKLETPASLPVKNPTKSFWLDTPGANPLAWEGSDGELAKDADVCIVGSGITGISTAWHLSQLTKQESSVRGIDIIILEARQFCSGATGRNGGHLTRNMFSSFIDRQALYNTSEAIKSFQLEQYTASSLIKFIEEKGLSHEVDLVEGGHISILRTRDDVADARKDWAAAQEAGLDVDVKWLGNTELVEKYGLNPALNYTGLFHAGHNVWPCKLVTHLFKDAKASQFANISLHTQTPVTAITRNPFSLSNEDSPSTTIQRRRWKVHTPRGSIACSHVVHATNGYASHLLPFLAGIEEGDVAPPSPSSARPPSSEERPPLPPHPHPQPPRSPPSQGLYGIVPTRGQVGAVRASADGKWLNSWESGLDSMEYWFPRYQDTESDGTTTATKNPLIILGGGRESAGGKLEAGISDDSTLNPLVSNTLRSFLPLYFPEQFILPITNETKPAESKNSWEMEWTGIMAFTESGDPFVGPVTVPEELTSWNLGGLEADYEGQYIAAGYTGHGMPRAYACAEAVAGMIKARIDGREWVKPSWLPQHYLSWATRP